VTPDLQATLKKLPDRPGVYLMRDARGDVVYVGKAQSLRNRVRSYWQKATPAGEVHRIRSVIDRVQDVEYTLTVTDTMTGDTVSTMSILVIVAEPVFKMLSWYVTACPTPGFAGIWFWDTLRLVTGAATMKPPLRPENGITLRRI
jgi:hypothetical protein